MAVVQANANLGGAGPIPIKDSGGYWYVEDGGIRVYRPGTGSPHGVITAPIGSTYTELGSHELWMNTDAGTSWEVVGTQS